MFVAVLAGVLGLASFAPSAQAATFEFNRAQNQLATQTSTGFGGLAGRAVDGNTDGNYWDNSVSHTLEDYQPYWQVDLGGDYRIDTVELFNRLDCCKERLHDVFVFASSKPMDLRYASETFQQDGVTTRLIFGQANDHHVLQFGVRARYIRIQLADKGYLSLAEVKALEHITVDGPAALATQQSWVATGVFTPASAFTLANLDGGLQSLHRGSDGKLHVADDVRFDSVVPGSPLITADPPAVVVDTVSKQQFVAVRGADNNLYVATVTPPVPPSTPRAWSWQVIAPTDSAPSLVMVDRKLVVAWLQGQHIRSTWRTPEGVWDTPTVHIDAITPPTLTRNKSNTIGMGFIRWDGSINFIQGTIDTAVHWYPLQTITGWSNGGRVGVAAWGDRFVVSALGGDARPYVAIQQPGGTWNGFEAAWGANDVKLMEAPTLLMFDGMMFILARDQNKALRYWMRNPNTLAYRYPAGQMWLGGRIVGGWGTGATPPALATVGESQVWGISGAPAELYVATRGIGDQQIYAFNFGRFVAVDVLTGQFGVALRANSSPQWDPKMSMNVFEHMIGFLSVPGANAWWTVNHNAACSSSIWGVQLRLHPDATGQAHGGECPPYIVLNASNLSAFWLFHEWMHVDHVQRGLASWQDYHTVFQYVSTPKLCTSDSDCGTDKCMNVDGQLDAFDDGTIRQWMGKTMCAVDNGDRPQGHVTYYALESVEHDFIETAQAYRWYGDRLKAQAMHDFFSGNTTLWLKYAWLRDHYFDGIEYNGADDHINDDAPNKNFGYWGMPNK